MYIVILNKINQNDVYALCIVLFMQSSFILAWRNVFYNAIVKCRMKLWLLEYDKKRVAPAGLTTKNDYSI